MPLSGLRLRLLQHLREPQHRTTYLLLLNTATIAATGLAFWVLLARLAASRAEIGLGYTIVSLGTITAILAKGGLDTALLRAVPSASREGAVRLLRLGAILGGLLAVVLAVALAVVAWTRAALPELVSAGWALVGAIGLLMVVTWLQDAYYLAEGRPGLIVGRSLVFCLTRLPAGLLVLLWSIPHAPAVAWALALAFSAAAGVAFARSLPSRAGHPAEAGAFLRSANRNIAGSAAEFLPGLLLAPVALALEGPEAAAVFGIAWTVALMLFLVASAIARSALASLVRDPAAAPAVLRKAALQAGCLVAPAALAIAVLAPWILAVFGQDYAREGAVVLSILAASAFVVAPCSLYLALLRARERTAELVLFPIAMVAALAVLAPALDARLGLEGIALAWALANAPWALFAAWRLQREARGVMTPAPPVGGRPHLE